MLNRQGRPTTPGTSDSAAPHTFTGNRALDQTEPLLFEVGRLETTGVDYEAPKKGQSTSGRIGAKR